MAIAYLKRPPYVSPAFNPILLVVQTPKARYAQLTKDLAATTDEAERAKIIAEMNTLEPDKEQDTLDQIYVSVQLGAGNWQKVVVQREPDADGKAEIDLSFIARHAFVNTSEVRNVYAIADYNTHARYTISDDSGEAAWNGRVVNAVRKLGASEEYPELMMTTQTPHFRYDGYPTTISFLTTTINPSSYYVMTRAGAVANGSIFSTVTNVMVSSKSTFFDRLSISKGGTVFEVYQVVLRCTPDAPFYVRWINALGGWNYWMFERREQILEVGDFTNIQRVATNQNDAQTTVSAAASEVVVTGEDLLDREQYNILSALPLSPRIEWYNEELKVWQVVVIGDDFSSTWSSRNSFGSVGFTFLMPRILTQL